MEKSIHVSGLKSFLKCERQFYYSDPAGLGLEGKKIVNHFFLGKLVHSVLEAYYSNLFASMHDAYTTILDIYVRGIGGEEEITRLYPAYDKETSDLYEVMIAYERHHRSPYMLNHPLGDSNLEYISFEFPVRFPIDASKNLFFGGRVDGLVRTSNGELYVLEHKTSARPSTLINSLQTEMQTAAYMIAMQKMGKPVSGVLYNIINKKNANPPELLKNGTLSKAKKTTISYTSYYNAIMGVHSDWTKEQIREEYEDILKYYASDEQHFIRKIVRRTTEEMEEFFRLLRNKARKMDHAIDNNVFFPTGASNPINCNMCRFIEPCLAANKKDYELEKILLTQSFKERTDRHEQLSFIAGYIVYRKQERYFVYDRSELVLEGIKQEVIDLLNSQGGLILKDAYEQL